MSSQHELFEHAYEGLRAISRNLDPQPSHEAAAYLHRTMLSDFQMPGEQAVAAES